MTAGREKYAAMWMRSVKPCNPGHADHEVAVDEESNEYSNRYYICAGCNELGGRERGWRCRNCDLIMHHCCVFRRLVPTPHPLFPDSIFSFQTVPPRNNDGEYVRVCDACAMPIRGFFYYSLELDLLLHPCCMNMGQKIRFEGEEFDLHRQIREKCMWCDLIGTRNGGDGWSYVSPSREHGRHIHVDCLVKFCIESYLSSSRDQPPAQAQPQPQPQAAPAERNDGWGTWLRKTIMKLPKMFAEVILEDFIDQIEF